MCLIPNPHEDIAATVLPVVTCRAPLAAVFYTFWRNTEKPVSGGSAKLYRCAAVDTMI